MPHLRALIPLFATARRHDLRFSAGLLLLCAACGHAEATSADEARTARRAAPPAAAAGEAPDRAKHMQATFWMAVTARDALIDGDLESARRAARELAAHDYAATLPERWRFWVKQMQQRADEVVLAPDLDSAARAVAALGLTCGNCHAEHRPHQDDADTPLEWRDPPEGIEARMHRHEIAADQLWLGLTGPSESAWQSGTVTLTRAQLEPPRKDGEPIEPQLAAKIEELRGIAQRARTAQSHPERAELYGELLSRCAGCHFIARGQQAQAR